jgi:hypothetical protein
MPLAFVIAAVLTAIVLALFGLRLRLRRKAVEAANVEAELDTVADWPPKAVRVLLLSERKALELVRRGMPKRHAVLAHVPLSRFITVPDKNSYAEWMRRAGRLTVDMLVCDASSKVIAVIDVRQPEHTERAQERETIIAAVVEAAGIPLHVWRIDALPGLAQVRALLEHDSNGSPDTLPGNAIGALPVAEAKEIDQMFELEVDESRFSSTVYEPVIMTFPDSQPDFPGESAAGPR